MGVCTSVVSGAKIFVRDRLLKVPDTTTLTELYEKVKPDIQLEGVVAKCAASPGSNWIDAELDNDVGLLVNDFGCKYVRFMVSVQDCSMEPPSKRVCTVNDVLMSVSRDRSKLPRQKLGKNRKEVLFNDVRACFEGRQIGFSPMAAESDGYEVVNTLTNCLWMIDTNLDTLDQASVKKGPSKVPKLPNVWRKFTGYNDYKSKKKAKPRLHASELQQTALDLFRIAGRPTIQSAV